MSWVCGYIDGDYRKFETDDDYYYAEKLEDSINSGYCAECGKRIDAWEDELEKFDEVETMLAMPLNVCAKCAIRAFKEGRF